MSDKDSLIHEADTPESSFTRLLDIIRVLRSPDGCPWDREQTPESLRPALVEEAYEIIDAINSGDTDHVREELGDVYLVITMITQIFSESGVFTLPQVLNEVSNKLVRRHPHVFGDVEVSDTEEVLKNWEEIKVSVEGKSSKNGLLDGIPNSFPPLERAFKMQKKAAKAGFDWSGATDVFPKIREEIDELEHEFRNGSMRDIEYELGDLLFSVVNLSRKLGIDPGQAINAANTKFHKRFSYIEKEMANREVPLGKDSIDLMEVLWNEAKNNPPR